MQFGRAALLILRPATPVNSDLLLPPTLAQLQSAGAPPLRRATRSLHFWSSRALSSESIPLARALHHESVSGDGWPWLHGLRAQLLPHVNVTRRNSTASSRGDPHRPVRPGPAPKLSPHRPKPNQWPGIL